MQSFINQNSYIFLAFVLVSLVLLLILRTNLTWLRVAIVLACVGVLVGINLGLRTQASPVGSVDRLYTTLGDGRPTMVEVYSNL